MQTFEITIQRGIDRKVEGTSVTRWPVVAEWMAPGSALPTRVEVDLALDRDRLEQASPGAYGIVLGESVFHHGVRDAFQGAFARVGDCLHVLLYIEAEEWKALRWERLAAPFDVGWTPMALNQRTPFAIHLPSVTARRYATITGDDLRALVVAASPILIQGRSAPGDEGWRLSPFDIDEAVRGVRASLASIPSDALTAVPLEPWKGPPTLDTLCNVVSGGSCTLLHIICHGRYAPKDGEPILFLLKPSEHELETTADAPYYAIDAVRASRLIERLGLVDGAHGLPHLVFLSACDGASPEAEEGLGGLAQRLVRDLGIPAVVAMTERISIETANAVSKEFYRRLSQHGMPDLALVQAFSGLAGRPDVRVPVPALFSRLAGKPLLSVGVGAKLTDALIAHGLETIRGELLDRAPILMPVFDRYAKILHRDQGEEVERPAAARRRDDSLARSGLDELCREVFESSFEDVARGRELADYDPRCPFRGLAAFNPFRPREAGDPHDDPGDDRRFFSGRDAWVKALLGRLRRHHFLAVLGDSGSGKSSLVLAGVIPGLSDRKPALMTPGRDPLAQLGKALAEAGPGPVAIVVDQFEEAFTLCQDDNARDKFFDLLLEKAKSTHVIITMRADFWGACARHDGLREAIKDHQELIPPMTLEELRGAMLHQAKEAGLRFETGLVGTILDDLDGEPGSMPLLQHALRELWKRRHGRWLRGEEYQAIGRVQGAVARTAEEVYNSLGNPDKALVKHVFLRLVRLDDGPAVGEAPRDTRRRVPLEELVPANGDLEGIRRLVNKLANDRLVVTTARGDDRSPSVEVIHEALIGHWWRLKQWVNEDRADLKLLQEIGEDAREWEKSQGDESFLNHRGARLVVAEELRKKAEIPLSALEERYIGACIARREADRIARERRQRWTTIGLTAGLVLVAALSVIAYFWRVAESERQRADRLAAELTIDRGISFCQQGRADDGLLWLMRGLKQSNELKPPDPTLDRLARYELATWRAELTSLRWFQKSSESVYAVAFSPDGLTALTGSGDRTARLWDVGSGQPKGPLLNHGGPVIDVAFSQDGTMVLTGSVDRTARLWDVATGLPKGPILRHDRWVVAVALSPDGRSALTGSYDQTARLWDLTSARPKGKVLKHDGPVLAVAFSPDGRTALTGSGDRAARLWDVASAKLKEPSLNHGDWVSAVAFSPDGMRALTGSYDQTARLWDVATGQPMGPTLEHDDLIYAVAFSPDGRTALIGSADRTARLWDLATGLPKGPPLRHGHFVNAVAFSPDGRTALTGSTDRTVRLWDLPSGQPKGPTLKHEGPVTAVAFSPNSRTVLTGSTDRTARLWDLASGQPKGLPLKHDGRVNAVAFSPDGHTALTGSADPTARLWDLASSQPKGPPLIHEASVNAVAFSPDGRSALTGSDDQTARLWDLANGQPKVSPLKHDSLVNAVAFSPDGRSALTGSADGMARLWDLETGGTERASLKHDGPVHAVAFSPDGRTVVTGSNDRTARLWDVSTRKPIGSPLDHGESVIGTAFSPDGTMVLTSGYNGTARLWLAKNQRPIGAPLSLGGPGQAVAFSPDGRWIAVASSDKTAQLWQTPVAVEGSLDRLELWVRVITSKQLDESGAARSLDLDTWQEYRKELDVLGGPPDRPGTRGTGIPNSQRGR
ncbi:MAG: CHAT domain-containing protein [Isosphaeraceae bacterium]